MIHIYRHVRRGINLVAAIEDRLACGGFRSVIFAATKFRDGAWVVLIIIPLLVKIFFTIHHHYQDLASNLSLDTFSGLPARQTRHRVILPVSAIHQGVLVALRYAKLLSDDVTVVHVSLDPTETEKVQTRWKRWGEGTPQFIPSKRWHYALHLRTADVLRQELLSKPGVVVTDIPYHERKKK